MTFLSRLFVGFILFIGIVVFNSCRKDVFTKVHDFVDESNFFLLPSTADPMMKRVASELKLQKEKNPKLIKTIIKRNGYPVWDRAQISKQRFMQRSMAPGEDTIVYIPLAVQGEDKVTAFFLATINNYVELQLYNKFEYEQFEFDTLGINNANRLALQFMILDFVAFGHKDFMIHDMRLLKDFEIPQDAPVNDRIIHIDYPEENLQGRGWEVWEFEFCTTTRFLNCSSGTNCCRVAGVAPGSCSACERCWDTKRTCKKISKLVYNDDGYDPPIGGGSGGGSSPGSPSTVQLCNPTPLIQSGLPPCPKGYSLGWEPIAIEPPNPCDKVNSFVANTDNSAFMQKVKDLGSDLNLNSSFEKAVSLIKGVNPSIAEETGAAGTAYVQIPNLSSGQRYNASGHNHSNLPGGSYSIFSIGDLQRFSFLLSNGQIISSEFVAFLSTFKGTHYTMTISNQQKFLDFFFSRNVTNLSTDFAKFQRAEVEFRRVLIKYFNGLTPLIKADDTDNNYVLDKFLDFMNEADLGITLFESNSDFTQFVKVEKGTDGVIQRTPCN